MTRTVRVDLNAVTLYHGGARGIQPGALILPPIHTGQPASARPDLVYVTVDPNLARYHAAMFAGKKGNGSVIVGRGSVYEVTPLDTALELDDTVPDDAQGYSIAVRGAVRVTRIVESQVRFSDPRVTPQALADQIVNRGGLTLNERAGLGANTLAAGRER